MSLTVPAKVGLSVAAPEAPALITLLTASCKAHNSRA